MPVMSLQEAISKSIQEGGGRAFITMSMHDADGPVLWGRGETAEFVADLPLRGATATISGGGSTTGIGHWFTRQPTPGFTTRGAAPGASVSNFYSSSQTLGVTTPAFDPNQRKLMNISLRRDPGIPILQWIRGGPSVQIEIEAGANAVTLNADEDGPYLRAAGPSIEDPTHRAIYTVTLDWVPLIA